MQLVTTLLDVVGVLAIAAGVTAALLPIIGPISLAIGGLIVIGASELAAWLAGRWMRSEP